MLLDHRQFHFTSVHLKVFSCIDLEKLATVERNTLQSHAQCDCICSIQGLHRLLKTLYFIFNNSGVLERYIFKSFKVYSRKPLKTGKIFLSVFDLFHWKTDLMPVPFLCSVGTWSIKLSCLKQKVNFQHHYDLAPIYQLLLKTKVTQKCCLLRQNYCSKLLSTNVHSLY